MDPESAKKNAQKDICDAAFGCATGDLPGVDILLNDHRRRHTRCRWLLIYAGRLLISRGRLLVACGRLLVACGRLLITSRWLLVTSGWLWVRDRWLLIPDTGLLESRSRNRCATVATEASVGTVMRAAIAAKV